MNATNYLGFYYICVEYEPSLHVDPTMTGTETDSDLSRHQEEDGQYWKSVPASMTGFYFHKNSEPNQQLNLRHVSNEEQGMGNGSFEWR